MGNILFLKISKNPSYSFEASPSPSIFFLLSLTEVW